jgi:hypothetical protein
MLPKACLPRPCFFSEKPNTCERRQARTPLAHCRVTPVLTHRGSAPCVLSGAVDISRALLSKVAFAAYRGMWVARCVFVNKNPGAFAPHLGKGGNPKWVSVPLHPSFPARVPRAFARLAHSCVASPSLRFRRIPRHGPAEGRD